MYFISSHIVSVLTKALLFMLPFLFSSKKFSPRKGRAYFLFSLNLIRRGWKEITKELVLTNRTVVSSLEWESKMDRKHCQIARKRNLKNPQSSEQVLLTPMMIFEFQISCTI